MNTLSTRMAMLGAVAALALIGLAISIRDTGAYPSYSDGSATAACAQCHENALGGFQSRGPLHDAHTNSATNTCSRCHAQSGDVPVITACLGCHGQPGTEGTGLKMHHALAGAPADGEGLFCGDCHSGEPAPAPESTLPADYGQADVQQTSPCNADGTEDFWSFTSGAPDGKGLDNDGDLLVDALDSDCAAPACVDNDGDGYGNPGHASCPNGPAEDCNDASAAAYPGASEIYDLIDNDCNTEVDEIKNLRFADPANHNQVSWDAQMPAVQIYDVIRSDGAQFPAASPNTLCLGNNVAVTALDDLVAPDVGQAFFYLVRNSFVGDYGKRSDGALRIYATCP